MGLDSIRGHLKSNHHSKRARDITTYIMDFLDPPKARTPIETRHYQADPSTSNSYIYQQTMPKNKEMFPWILQVLDTAPMPARVHKPHYLLVKDPINIPLNSTDELKDPRLDYYPSTSPSWVDQSELDQMLRAQLETEVTENTTTDRPADERTLAMQWITLDSIGTVNDF